MSTSCHYPDSRLNFTAVAVAKDKSTDARIECMNGSDASSIAIDGHSIPRFLYGTAWKEDATERLAQTAIEAGFRGIDTANQRRHYHEAQVGLAVQNSIASGLVIRDQFFLQTKFTFRGGQDHRLPYDPAAPVSTQVEQSFASSLDHLRTEYIDSYVLHGPSQRSGLGDDDWQAWRAMEVIHDSERARFLGVSNVSLEQLQELYEQARVKPRFVQNRCFAVTGWDYHVRTFCTKQGILYQGFSLLTANQDVLRHPELARIANTHGRTPQQVVFRFALDIGMLPLTGTTDADHMREDIHIFDFQLAVDEVNRIERIAIR